MKREQILWFLTVSTCVSAVPVVIKQEFLRCGFREMELFRLQSLKICIMEKVRSKLPFIMLHVLRLFAHYMIHFFSGGP
jgi:hypothetical protein